MRPISCRARSPFPHPLPQKCKWITCQFFQIYLLLGEANFLWPPFSFSSSLATTSQILCFVWLPLVIPLGIRISQMPHERCGAHKCISSNLQSKCFSMKRQLGKRHTLSPICIHQKQVHKVHSFIAETLWHIKTDESVFLGKIQGLSSEFILTVLYHIKSFTSVSLQSHRRPILTYPPLSFSLTPGQWLT